MRREAERTLLSLSKSYQRGVDEFDYEVVVVDNGSPEPLGRDFVERFGAYFRYVYLEDAPSSPAHAINVGAAAARGDVLAVMIDGAHMLTPGVLKYARLAFGAYACPVVATRHWFLGPGQQGDTILRGYNQQEEDRLLTSINWPENGYRLFEIGEFIGEKNPGWFGRCWESNCLFLTRRLFDAIGGADERFDYPGGGFVNLDLFREAAEHRDATLVYIMGEASFHQVHGGTTTNVAPEERERRVEMYRAQYQRIRGRGYQLPMVPVDYVGHLPTEFRSRPNG